MLLAQSRGFEDWGQLVLVLLFVVAPLIARVLRWLAERVSTAAGQGRSAETPELRRERARARRAERRTAELEGEEVWKRILRGEEPEPPRPVPVEVAPRPARTREPEAAAPDPLSVLGREEAAPERALPETALPEVATEISLEGLATAPPLDVLRHGQEPGPAGERPRALSPRPWIGGKSDLRRAVVLAEVLGPPLSQRR
jgi:hypothetical protein